MHLSKGLKVLLEYASPVFASLLLMTAFGAHAAGDAAPPARVQLAQVTIEQRVIIRIPVVPQRPGQRGAAALSAPLPPQAPPAPSFKEVKGPKCLKVDQLRGALINSSSGVTMVTDRNERYRAHFGRMCRPADFESGFYLQPHKDGSVCAGRDALHARNGATCDIERFGKLVPGEDDDD